MSTRSPQVSVVIPAYNSAQTVTATVQSVLGQTVSDLEAIVVDDGSSDNTVEVVQAIDDSRVRVVRQANAGAAAARNTGVESATGEWVALLDADDLWLPNKLERQLAVLEADPSALAVHSGVYFVDDDLKVLYVRPCTQPEDLLLTYLRFQNLPGVASTWMIARRMFEPMGMFDPSLVILEDWDISIKAARHCNPVCMSEPLSLIRVHPGNRSRNLDIHIEPGFKVLGRLFGDPALPAHIRKRKREIYARFYAMLSGGAFKVGQWRECARWALRAFFTDPRISGYIASMPIRRLRRRISVAQHDVRPANEFRAQFQSELRVNASADTGSDTR
jgi:glycosyltransferase involved in cell wall biosynthesis